MCSPEIVVVLGVCSTLSFEQWVKATHIPSEHNWNIIISYCFWDVICVGQCICYVPSASFSPSCHQLAVLQKHEFCWSRKVHARRPQYRLVLGNRKRTISKPINLLISSCPRSVNLDLRNAIKTKCIYAIQRRANECPKMLEVYVPLPHNLVMGRKIQNQK
jgi:hypothetical protein